MSHKTSGTKEWADKNLNIYLGCSENCEYCYAKRIAKRYGRIINESDWENMKLNETVYNGSIPKTVKGKPIEWFMFPSSHNVNKENVDMCIPYLIRVLRETNAKILVVMKPHSDVIKKMVSDLWVYSNRILFRFTITAINPVILKSYEPNAPSLKERLHALMYAHSYSWKTSVSIEPFLDKDPVPLITMLAPFVSDTIWIGIMSGSSYPYHTKQNVAGLIYRIKALPDWIKSKVRLKDSIVNKWGFSLNEG